VPYGYDGVVLVRKILEPGEPVPADPEALGRSRLLAERIRRHGPLERHRRGDGSVKPPEEEPRTTRITEAHAPITRRHRRRPVFRGRRIRARAPVLYSLFTVICYLFPVPPILFFP
jgi:hypothetical protein